MTAHAKIRRAHVRATTRTPWQVLCRLCAEAFTVDRETAELAGRGLVRTASWWQPTRDDAQDVALAHLGQHEEVAG